MPTYVSMLRGINVSGHKIIKMEQLRRSFDALHFKNVKTYLQSGNVIFETAKSSPLDLSGKIEKKILSDFGFVVPVTIRTSKELANIIEKNPFLKTKGTDQSRLHVTFLSQAPLKDDLKNLDALDAGPDQFRYLGKEIYLYCPDGYGRSKLSNNALERALRVSATTRNWNTVNQLCEISSG